MPRSATAASAGWRPASSIRWRRSACRASATASATNTACSARRIVDGAAGRDARLLAARAAIRGSFQRPEVTYPRALRRPRAARAGTATARRSDWVDTARRARRWPTTPSFPATAPQATNTLRLWSARATDESTCRRSTAATTCARGGEQEPRRRTCRACSIPDDSTHAGRELRLRQEYFFVSRDDAGSDPPLSAHAHALRAAGREGRDPPERHAPGAGDARTDAPAGRRAPPAVGQGLGARAAGVLATPTTR